MRRFVSQVLALALTLAFSGGVSLAATWSSGAADHCKKPSHACCGETLTRCACSEGAHDAPTTVPATTSHSSISKAHSRDVAFLPTRVVVSAPSSFHLTTRGPTHPGRLLPLPILHVALLI